MTVKDVTVLYELADRLRREADIKLCEATLLEQAAKRLEAAQQEVKDAMKQATLVRQHGETHFEHVGNTQTENKSSGNET